MRPRHLAPVLAFPLVVALAAPAQAAVNISYVGTSYNYEGDDAVNAPAFSCFSGNVSPASTPDAPCAQVETMSIDPHGDADVVTLSSLNATSFPKLSSVFIITDDDSGGIDTVNGGPLGERYTAGFEDLIFSGGGNDYVEGGAQIDTGDGNDIVNEAGGGLGINLGPGDDRLIQTLTESPGMDGGTGDDSIEIDFHRVALKADLGLVMTPTAFKVSVGTLGNQDFKVNHFEHAILTLLESGTQSVDGTAFPGDLEVRGFGGRDIIVGTKKTDVLRGGAGSDSITSVDGKVDIVDCGLGADTAIVDKIDLVSGCESVKVGPQTSAIKGPKTIKKGNTGKFTFSSPIPGSVFHCKVDAKAWKACKSPYSLKTDTLAKGKHTLQVRSGFPKGNWDKTPSKKAFTVT